ncbi:DUF4352 domain-containing protein [Proteiniclasticum sp. C24MP]|uniref:DUF4352 domain-containing protein n=1 Tax=Proteiniclasticum sp. C24MP TaxID=3374101 RepID=UPI00375416D2
MKFEMDKMVKKSEELVKKGEGMAKDMIPKVKDATSDLKESLANMMDKGTQSAQQLFEKKDSVKEDAVRFARSSRKDASDALEGKSGKKNTGKIVAGVAVAAAAAAAYAMYKKNKIKNENLKQEYSEKLTRWAELDLDEIESETDGFVEPMKVTPKKVYKAGSNALIDDIVVNISNPKSDFTFNPDDDGEPVADLDLKKAVLDKTEAVREKIRTKIEEGKLQTKLGSMEAKDKYVEIKDLAEDKFETAKAKVDHEIAPNVKQKAEDLKSEAEEKLEGFKKQSSVDEAMEEVQKEIKDKSNEAKKKFEDLKSKVASAADEIEEKTDGYMKNDMAFDDEDAFEPENDNFVDEPFGAQELIDDVEENAEGLKDKVKHLAENAKAKIMPEKSETGEDQELIEYKVTVHNRGTEDYSFNPMQLQLYDLTKRSVHIMAKHEDGTTLGRVTVKPGETYTGKLFLKISKEKKHGILFFKDLSLDYSVLFLTEDENPVEKDPTMVLDEDYLYSDKEVLEEHVDYKRL